MPTLPLFHMYLHHVNHSLLEAGQPDISKTPLNAEILCVLASGVSTAAVRERRVSTGSSQQESEKQRTGICSSRGDSEQMALQAGKTEGFQENVCMSHSRFPSHPPTAPGNTGCQTQNFARQDRTPETVLCRPPSVRPASPNAFFSSKHSHAYPSKHMARGKKRAPRGPPEVQLSLKDTCCACVWENILTAAGVQGPAGDQACGRCSGGTRFKTLRGASAVRAHYGGTGVLRTLRGLNSNSGQQMPTVAAALTGAEVMLDITVTRRSRQDRLEKTPRLTDATLKKHHHTSKQS
ncbi:hypothetical protein IRJ41_007228 [Triplophysa rosa]|uniref:Uncharacterized protein n=1 Tax=Triplophysa rosa TaxID=992332 RepID=A0A9W7T6V2_TRIRA|nr:hypothetical protein IRJ41_007228 [Triplophysa rosa]